MLTLRDMLFSMCSGRSVVIASLRRYILYDKMESSSLTLFQTAGRMMGELCPQFDEKFLSDIVPILKGKSTSMDSRTRAS